MSKSGIMASKLQHVSRILAAVADEECKKDDVDDSESG